jgi:hypothetical protein
MLQGVFMKTAKSLFHLGMVVLAITFMAILAGCDMETEETSITLTINNQGARTITKLEVINSLDAEGSASVTIQPGKTGKISIKLATDAGDGVFTGSGNILYTFSDSTTFISSVQFWSTKTGNPTLTLY